MFHQLPFILAVTRVHHAAAEQILTGVLQLLMIGAQCVSQPAIFAKDSATSRFSGMSGNMPCQITTLSRAGVASLALLLLSWLEAAHHEVWTQFQVLDKACANVLQCLLHMSLPLPKFWFTAVLSAVPRQTRPGACVANIAMVQDVTVPLTRGCRPDSPGSPAQKELQPCCAAGHTLT